MYYTYTPSFRKDHSIIDWLSIVKTKPRSRVQVVEDDNDKVIWEDYVFQMDELVHLNFCVIENIYIDFDVDQLNIILSTGRHKENNNDMRSTLNLTKKMILDKMIKTIKRRIIIKKC